MADEQARRSLARIDHATLLAAAGRGPGGAAGQREACRKVLAQVYRVVAAVLGPRSSDVADVAQDAFVRVFRGIGGFSYDESRPGGPAAWINRIALHAALDHRAGLPPWEPLDEAGPERAGDGGDLGGNIDRVLLAAALLERLDERHRAILILHYWNGETAEEIAATLSIPVGTVKTRMRAAHQKIKVYAEEHAGGFGALQATGTGAGGSMRPDHEPLASQALSALADQCEIPEEVEERILSAVLDGALPPPPIVPLPRAEAPHFENVIRLARQEQRFWRWVGRAAAAATLVLGVLVVVHRPTGPSRSSAVASPPAYAPLPAGVRGKRVSDGHPRLEEARAVMFRLVDRVSRECKVARWSADLLFEKTGRATVLGVSSGGAAGDACVGRVLSGARARSQAGPRLAIRYEVGGGAASGTGAIRIVGWIVDES